MRRCVTPEARRDCEMTDYLEHFAGLGYEPSIGDAFVPPSDEELKEIEVEIGLGLPESYRLFAKRFGRSSCFEGSSCFCAAPGSPEVRDFFGGGARRLGNVLLVFRLYRWRMPLSFVPVAGTSGDLFCLDLAGPTPGGVYHWEHHAEPELDEFKGRGEVPPHDLAYSNTRLLAATFPEFLRGLDVTP